VGGNIKKMASSVKSGRVNTRRSPPYKPYTGEQDIQQGGGRRRPGKEKGTNLVGKKELDRAMCGVLSADR